MYESYFESKISARGGAPASPDGGGTRSTIASSSSSHPVPSFAETKRTSSREKPITSTSSCATRSGSAEGRSILFTTGMIVSPLPFAAPVSCPSAMYTFASVCASIPCEASTTSSAPSQAASARDTSYVKSTWPGVSIRFSSYVSGVR